MTKRRNSLFAVMLIVLLLSLSGNVFAQYESFCLDLEAADCELLEQFQFNQESPASTAMQASVVGEVSTGDTQTEFAVNISGAYVTDKAAVETALETFGAVTLRDLSLGDVVTLLDGLASAWDAELKFDLSAIPGAEMLTGGETIDLYFVDGVAYINSPLLILVSGDPSLEGVYGIDVFEAVDFALGNVTMADLGLNDMGAGRGMGGRNGFAGAFNQEFMNAFQQMSANQMLSEADLASFASLARLDDEVVDGETLVVFETTIDFGKMFTVPAMQEMMFAEMARQDPMMDTDALIQALEAGLAGSTITAVQKWNPETNYLVGFDMHMDLKVDGAAMSAAMGMTSTDDETFNMILDINFMLEDINQVEAITLPADAQIVPLMELIGGQ